MTWLLCLVPITFGLVLHHLIPQELMNCPVRLKVFWEKFRLKSGRLFRGQQGQSQELIRAIFGLERQLQSGSVTGQFDLPQYKNYTALLNDLLSSQRRFGVPLKQALSELREFLRHEGKFSRKWDEERQGGVMQLLMMAFISWLFIYISLGILEVNLAWWMWPFLLGSHFSGGFIYYAGLQKISSRFFDQLLTFQEVVFRFRVFRRSGLPAQTILHKVAPGDLDQLGVALSELRQQLFELIHQWRESGVALEQELKGLEDEIGLRLELGRDRALKWEKALRLGVLILFYVVPYLGHLFFLLASLSGDSY